MAISQTAIPVLCLVCFLLAPYARGQEEATPTRLRVASALYFRDAVILLSGTSGMVMRNYTEVHLNPNIHPYWLDSDSVYGAAYFSFDQQRINMYGHNRSFLIDMPNQIFESHQYNATREFLNAGAPDAAAKRDGQRYFFRGCEMVIKYSATRWSETTPDVTELGLPCNMDAAWYEPDVDRMVILRGDQIWFWKDDGSVSGPQPFADTYRIHSWVLEPYTEP